MSTPQRAIGTKATLNGKPVYWSGDDHGWQSSGSHLKLKAAGKFNEPNALERIGGLINGYLQPLGSSQPKHVRNKRAEAALRANQRAAEWGGQEFSDGSTQRTFQGAGGLKSYSTSKPTGEGFYLNDLQGLTPYTAGREADPDGFFPTKEHGISFYRETKDDNAWEARTDSRPAANKVRQANIKWQMGELMDDIATGDELKISVADGDGKGTKRAGLYSRQTNKALQPIYDDDYFTGKLQTKRGVEDFWSKGQDTSNESAVRFKPSNLKKPLEELAKGTIVRRLVTNPYLQGALTADEVIGGITGTRPSKAIADAHIKAMTKYFEGTGVRAEAVYNFHRGQLKF